MTRELLQQALEALENIQEVLADPSDLLSTDVDLVLYACTALRQALAQPEQEPVAWFYEGWRSGITGQPQWFDEVEFVQPPNNEQFRNITPLYAAPPQRQPLTHEQRFDLLAAFEEHKHEWHASAILIDMVEAAHNIKEKNSG